MPTNDTQPLRLLIVDDEVPFTELMYRMLKKFPYHLRTANSGPEALAKMREEPADILITDVRMPGMSGIDLMRTARELYPDLQVIAISAHGEMPIAIEIMKLGAADFIQKPVDNTALQLEIESVAHKLRLGRQLRQADEDLRRANQSLQEEIKERKEAETRLTDTNQRLVRALEDLKRAQQKLIEKERIEALGKMARGVAHDFNNALQPIMLAVGMLQVQLEDVPEPLHTELEATLNEIIVATTNASESVRRLVHFYRREGTPDTVRFDLNLVARAALDITRPKWRDEALVQGRTINCELDLGPDCYIDGSSDEIREALVNLVFNAEQAIHEQGTITLRTRRDQEHVILEVADTGSGMSEELRRFCLEPFHGAMVQDAKGLGLATVYGIVMRHKGEVAIDSAPNRGTVVRMTFPAAAIAAATPPPPPAPPPPPRPTPAALHILVVDDAPQVIAMLSQILQRLGHKVTPATNGLEGLQAFQKGAFDLVISDQAMPEMTGDQMIERIKKTAPQIPVIMLTGFGDLIRDANGQYPNVDILLSKPIEVAKLQDAIRQLTGRPASA